MKLSSPAAAFLSLSFCFCRKLIIGFCGIWHVSESPWAIMEQNKRGCSGVRKSAGLCFSTERNRWCRGTAKKKEKNKTAVYFLNRDTHSFPRDIVLRDDWIPIKPGRSFGKPAAVWPCLFCCAGVLESKTGSGSSIPSDCRTSHHCFRPAVLVQCRGNSDSYDSFFLLFHCLSGSME